MASMMVGGMEVIESANTGDLDFQGFIERLRPFALSEVVRIASHISWTIWNSTPPDPEPEAWYLCRAQMPNIAILALSVCDDGPSRRTPTEAEMIRLASDLLCVRTPISDDAVHMSELAALRTALSTSKHFAGVATEPADLRAIYAFITAAREIRSQWASRSNSPAGLARAWAIANNVEALEPGLMAHFQANWGGGLRDVLLSIAALMSIAGSNNPDVLGAFGLNVENAETATACGIPVSLLQRVAARLAQQPPFFRQWCR